MSGTTVAYAQSGFGCRSPLPPSVGVAVGRSDPYVELDTRAVDPDPAGSLGVRAGTLFAGRADLPVAGPLRVRIEAATARWDVRQTIYDPDAGYRVNSDASTGGMTARHLLALVGLRTGRAPACAHVSAGGGIVVSRLDFVKRHGNTRRGDTVRGRGLGNEAILRP